MRSVESRLYELLEEHDICDPQRSDRFREDYEWDSFQIAEFTLECEKEFSYLFPDGIPDEMWDEVSTVGDAINYLNDTE